VIGEALSRLKTNYAGTGGTWLQPQAILPARLFKISAHIEF